MTSPNLGSAAATLQGFIYNFIFGIAVGLGWIVADFVRKGIVAMFSS